MMHQYLRIKESYRDAILFFRLGDFYEMFFEDAETASRILDIALTFEEQERRLRCAFMRSALPFRRALYPKAFGRRSQSGRL